MNKCILECSNARWERASNGRGENSVRTMKYLAQRQKESINALGITFSIKDPVFALGVWHSEWILHHLGLSPRTQLEEDDFVLTGPTARLKESESKMEGTPSMQKSSATNHQKASKR